MNTYPRVVKIEDPKLKKLMEEKGDMVLEGREVSQEIEEIEIQMKKVDEEIQAEEAKVDISDLKPRADAATLKVNEAMSEMKAVKDEIYARMKSQVPKSLHEKYESLIKLKEEKESARNKIALKIQKWKDKIIPLAQKLMKPFLQDEFDDYNDLVLENGEVVGTIFNHQDEFLKRQRNKQRAN